MRDVETLARGLEAGAALDHVEEIAQSHPKSCQIPSIHGIFVHAEAAKGPLPHFCQVALPKVQIYASNETQPFNVETSLGSQRGRTTLVGALGAADCP